MPKHKDSKHHTNKPKHKDCKHYKKNDVEIVKKYESEDGDITINVMVNIFDSEIHIEQRAEGGGQINKDVGMNANQGGQNARNHSGTSNDRSNFADGNGRSGIAGKENDEAGGQ